MFPILVPFPHPLSLCLDPPPASLKLFDGWSLFMDCVIKVLSVQQLCAIAVLKPPLPTHLKPRGVTQEKVCVFISLFMCIPLCMCVCVCVCVGGAGPCTGPGRWGRPAHWELPLRCWLHFAQVLWAAHHQRGDKLLHEGQEDPSTQVSGAAPEPGEGKHPDASVCRGHTPHTSLT